MNPITFAADTKVDGAGDSIHREAGDQIRMTQGKSERGLGM